ncbi:MAG: hypothetical protein WBH99_13000, partial [Azovibrio sp.]|uniref:hypothetical protein n=1 Tax=Azovibrio sp. TaxID=1872673 RepID=UPI003C717EBB
PAPAINDIPAAAAAEEVDPDAARLLISALITSISAKASEVTRMPWGRKKGIPALLCRVLPF